MQCSQIKSMVDACPGVESLPYSLSSLPSKCIAKENITYKFDMPISPTSSLPLALNHRISM